MHTIELDATNTMKLANRDVLKKAINNTLVENDIAWVGSIEFAEDRFVANFKSHSFNSENRFYDYEKTMLKFIKLVDVLNDINWDVDYDTETTLTKEEYDFLYDWFVDIIYDAFNIDFGTMNNVADRFINVLYGKCDIIDESEVK